MRSVSATLAFFLTLILSCLSFAGERRVLLDAHNCYPYSGMFANRIDRALSEPLPLAIEQDLTWHVDPATGQGRSVLSHETKTTGSEPSMREYFFERVRPIVEKELRGGDRSKWPVIVLNLDFKTNEEAHLRAVWQMLSEYRDWLTTAPKTADASKVEALDVKPVLVLTGNPIEQERIFHDAVPAGERLLLFGAVATPKEVTAATPPQVIVPGRATNYRRWWNNPWSVVEQGGQKQAGKWTGADQKRLRSLVKHAHENGLWIRFYTLNGHPLEASRENQWSPGYNFGSQQAAEQRWRDCIRAGVDFVATDQFEAFGTLLKNLQK